MKRKYTLRFTTEGTIEEHKIILREFIALQERLIPGRGASMELENEDLDREEKSK